MKEKIGSIIERKLVKGGVSYQAMVKIPGAKAAVKTFKDRTGAEDFLEKVRAERDGACQGSCHFDHAAFC